MGAFQRGLAIDPDNLWVHQELAKTLIRMDRKEEAIELLQTAVEINPSFGPGYLMMGLIYEEQGNTEKAEANFREALAHRVRQTSELVAVAQVCVRKGWFAEALACYEDALRLSPADPTLYLVAAECLDALKRPAEAERHYIQLIRLAPQSAQARYAFGVHFAKRELHGRAAEQFEAAAHLNPDYLEARINLGMALIGDDRLREALAQFNQVLSRDPAHATALEYKALIEQELEKQQN
jgi:tetratricopeptide (TPR) repeat protein